MKQDGEELLERIFAMRAIAHEKATAPFEERSIAVIHVAHLIRGKTTTHHYPGLFACRALRARNHFCSQARKIARELSDT